MAGAKLDGAGTAKLGALEEAQTMLGRVHSLVEQFGVEVKRNGNTSHYVQQIKRVLPNLVGLLKPQFGMIADQAAAVNLAAGRGSSDQMRLRALREGVAQIRQAMEIAEKQVRDKHTIKDEHPADEPK